MVAVVAGVFSFLSAFDEAHELQDDVLRQVAQLMFDRQRLLPAVPTDRLSGSRMSMKSRASIVQRLGEVSRLCGRRGRRSACCLLPATLADGLHTLEVGGETVSRAGQDHRDCGERIAVAQESGFRNEIARDRALRTVMPFLDSGAGAAADRG
ncbi:MAG: hypothetical protein V9G23_00180 [Giesbergeria sp.]